MHMTLANCSRAATNTDSEQLVKSRQGAVQRAKTALDEAQATRATAQKEVVALLERKHSWSASDLERYMSLIRSEHAFSSRDLDSSNPCSADDTASLAACTAWSLAQAPQR